MKTPKMLVGLVVELAASEGDTPLRRFAMNVAKARNEHTRGAAFRAAVDEHLTVLAGEVGARAEASQ